MEQIRKILEKDFYFNLSLWKDWIGYKINIRGNKNFIKWMDIIGSNNPKNLQKYSDWLDSIRNFT